MTGEASTFIFAPVFASTIASAMLRQLPSVVGEQVTKTAETRSRCEPKNRAFGRWQREGVRPVISFNSSTVDSHRNFEVSARATESKKPKPKPKTENKARTSFNMFIGAPISHITRRGDLGFSNLKAGPERPRNAAVWPRFQKQLKTSYSGAPKRLTFGCLRSLRSIKKRAIGRYSWTLQSRSISRSV